jgi:cobalt-zinc-cadmium efflux system protein
LPRGLCLLDVGRSIEAVEGVLGVHDLHIWSLGSSTRALSCHVRIADVPPSESDAILRGVNSVLAARFQIGHTTIQFEHAECAISENGCAIPARAGEREGHRHA